MAMLLCWFARGICSFLALALACKDIRGEYGVGSRRAGNSSIGGWWWVAIGNSEGVKWAVAAPQITCTNVRPHWGADDIAGGGVQCHRVLKPNQSLENTTSVSSVKCLIVSKYLMWEGNVFFLPWIAYCEGLSICPPLSCNLRWFIGLLSMSSVELLNYRELYESFMKLLVELSGAWVRGRVVHTYPMDWWNTTFDAGDYRTFTSRYCRWSQTTLPNCQKATC
ncbi:hypothetical protein EDB19DRAFT_1836547 [Suillus lakei]|nr:hypothetical protein EDB19DRAFT_1836547 [Suillus lakei]